MRTIRVVFLLQQVIHIVRTVYVECIRIPSVDDGIFEPETDDLGPQIQIGM